MAARFVSAVAILERLEDALRIESLWHADVASQLKAALLTEAATLQDDYCNVNWWGGSGSVADLSPTDVRRNRLLKTLLIELVAAFSVLGYRCPRAEGWVQVFQGWIRDGII